MVPPLDEKVHALESGRGESPRLRQSAPAPLTEGYRTWYMAAMEVSFFFWSFTKENKKRECAALCGSEKNQSCFLKKFMKIKFFCFWAVEFIVLKRNAFFVLYSWSLHSTKQKIREDRQIRFLTYKWISAWRTLAPWKQGNFFQLFLPCECFAWFLFPKCIWMRNFILHLS